MRFDISVEQLMLDDVHDPFCFYKTDSIILLEFCSVLFWDKLRVSRCWIAKLYLEKIRDSKNVIILQRSVFHLCLSLVPPEYAVVFPPRQNSTSDLGVQNESEIFVVWMCFLQLLLRLSTWKERNKPKNPWTKPQTGTKQPISNFTSPSKILKSWKFWNIKNCLFLPQEQSPEKYFWYKQSNPECASWQKSLWHQLHTAALSWTPRPACTPI